MQTLETSEKIKIDLYRKLIEYYKLLNLFEDKSNHNKVIQEIIRVYGFILTLKKWDVQYCLPPEFSPNTYEEIQEFLDDNALDFLEITFEKRLQTVFINDLDKLQNNVIKTNRNTLNICKKRNISFVLPIVKKIDDELESFEIDLSIKKKKDIDLDI